MNGARRLETVCLVLLGALLLGTTLAYVGSWSWFFDLFSHFRVQYAVLGATLAVIFGVRKRALLAALSIATLLANLPPIVPQFVRSASAAPAALSPPIRVLSFNVFKYSHEHQRLVQFVGEESPDVVILMEVTPAWAQALGALAAQYPYRWVNPR